MKITVRGIVSFTSLIILALTSIATPLLAQTKSLKDQLVGHWQLVSVTIETRKPYGPNPKGSMFLDAGGHFSVIVISSGNARSLSYFGTYTVNDADKTMALRIDGNAGGLGISLAGHDEKRLISFSGDELVSQNTTPSGTPGNVQLTWKQAN